MKYLLNCRECDWYTYVSGSIMEASIEKDLHEDSVRTIFDDSTCSADSVALTLIPPHRRPDPR